MTSTLAHSVLNIISTFSPEDMAVFTAEFAKLQKPEVAKMKPKKIKPIIKTPSLEEAIAYIMEKNNISEQD